MGECRGIHVMWKLFLGSCLVMVLASAYLLYSGLSVRRISAQGLNASLPQSSGDRRRYLIYLCDSSRWCGGLGDRQRGILGTLALATVFNWTFAVQMTSPCDFQRFYEPNQYDWRIKPETLAGLSEAVVDGFQYDLSAEVLAGDFEKNHPEDVIYLKTNDILANKMIKVPNLQARLPARVFKPDVIRDYWWWLMKPTQHIENHLTKLFKPVSGPRTDKDLLCAHVRMARSSTLPNDDNLSTSLSDLDVLWRFADQYVTNGSYFFLATDSYQVRQVATQRFGEKLIQTGGKILHIDRQRDESGVCDAFEVAIIEQIALSRCRHLVITKHNFSNIAAFLRGHNRNLFRFFQNNVLPFVLI